MYNPSGDVNNEKAMHVWEQGVYGKIVYLTLNFAVNLKLLLKNKILKKNQASALLLPKSWFCVFSFKR